MHAALVVAVVANEAIDVVQFLRVNIVWLGIFWIAACEYLMTDHIALLVIVRLGNRLGGFQKMSQLQCGYMEAPPYQRICGRYDMKKCI